MIARLSVAALLFFTLFWGSLVRANPETAEDYIAVGDFAGARMTLARLVAGRPDAALHMAQLEGMILLRQGKHGAAADVFRKILAVAPSYAPARRSLTETLILLGDIGAAAWHAERLLTVAPDDWERDALAALVSQGQIGKPSGVALRFAFLPSSNANRGTEEETVLIGGLPFVVDEASRAKSSIGLSFGVSAWLGRRIAPNWTATIGSSLDAKVYEGAIDEEANISLRLDLARSSTNSRVSFGPLADIRFIGGAENRLRFGFGVHGARRLNATSELQAALTHWRQEYDLQAFRDGSLTEGRLGYRRAFSPSTIVSLGLTFERERTQRAHLDHDEVGIVLGAEREWKGGLISSLTAGFRRDDYKGLYPGTSVARDDSVTTLGVSLRHRDVRVGRFLPEFTYTYTHARSNVPLHAYEAHDLSLALSTNF